MTAIGFGHHNHAGCIAEAMQAAETLCAEQKLQFTPIRRRVLELLLQDHRALGAYDILEKLAAEGLGAQPPVAYRALDFLVEHGLAHRIRRLNAFAACAHPGEVHAPLFLICQGCNAVAETPAPAVRAEIDATALALGFAVALASVEAVGLCPACRS